MDDRGIQYIEDDLVDDAAQEWAERGVRELEGYLAKHLAFLTFLDETSA